MTKKKRREVKPGDLISYFGYQTMFPLHYYEYKNVTEIELKKAIVEFFENVIGMRLKYEDADAVYILARKLNKKNTKDEEINKIIRDALKEEQSELHKKVYGTLDDPRPDRDVLDKLIKP